MKRSCVVVALIGLVASVQVRAQQFTNQCKQAGKDSQKLCDDAAARAVANEQAYVATQNPGQAINPNAATSGSSIGGQQENIAQALAECTKAKTSCEQKCKQADSQAQAKVASNPPPSPQYGPAKADAAQVKPTQQSDCDQELDKKIAALNANKDPLAGQKDQSKDTGQQSGMQMPQIPSIPSGDKSSDTPAATTPTPAAVAADPTFTAPADGSAGFVKPTNSASPGATPTTSLTEQSSTATAARTGTTTGSGSATSGGSSGGGAMGGSLGAGASLSPASVGDKSGAREGLAVGPGSLSVEGGGGGGGFGGGNDTGDLLTIPHFGEKEKPLLPASAIAGSSATDISVPHGPSIFYISDSAIGNWCKNKGVKKNCAK